MGELLASQLSNQMYTEFDTAVYDQAFSEVIDSLSPQLKNEPTIRNFYTQNRYTPTFTLKHLANKNLDSLIYFLEGIGAHGLKPSLFKTAQLKALLQKFSSNQLSQISEAYRPMAQLEILFADAYISYVGYLKFGTVDPKKVFANYFINVKQPDSLFAINLLRADGLLDTLHQVQYKNKAYKILQNAFLKAKTDSSKRRLAANLERMRWVLPEMGDEFVQVNIPSYQLVYFRGQDTLTAMKVCVGAKVKADYEKRLKMYEETGDYEDKPKNHETPQIYSTINQFYTNPVWNIPESIASNEIYEQVRKSSYYLIKNNIKVYYKNKLVTDPTKIRWADYDREKLPFRFVQQSGPANALGKFKFAFNNSSSIFLHDTNNKKAFTYNYRAISHGCIRLERPLALAKLLVADEESYDLARAEIGLAPASGTPINGAKKQAVQQIKNDEIEMVAFPTKKPIPLLITYFTVWVKNNKVVQVPDVYGLDEKLWLAMNKL